MNIQDLLLNQLRREKVKVVIQTLNGDKYEGTIKGFDNFCIFFNTDNGFVLLYKHALLKIVLPKDFILKAPDRESTRRT